MKKIAVISLIPLSILVNGCGSSSDDDYGPRDLQINFILPDTLQLLDQTTDLDGNVIAPLWTDNGYKHFIHVVGYTVCAEDDHEKQCFEDVILEDSSVVFEDVEGKVTVSAFHPFDSETSVFAYTVGGEGTAGAALEEANMRLANQLWSFVTIDNSNEIADTPTVRELGTEDEQGLQKVFSGGKDYYFAYFQQDVTLKVPLYSGVDAEQTIMNPEVEHHYRFYVSEANSSEFELNHAD
ncbi:hypothetical protein ACFSJ3_03590 [Corallincola platygyrae]|uniref:Uncharacterized protein n=1 Tax=Corallincola platygyrae TaxID=1193278 RepID=A0ABW4XLA7_9GAMM